MIYILIIIKKGSWQKKWIWQNWEEILYQYYNVIYLLLLMDDIEELKSGRSNVTDMMWLSFILPVKTDGMSS
mgnify:CR=1 FL=1